ncbi:hypothetical protein [Streptomyces ipomoeae]|uniref:hypothetical protein n=1 Tax=Streptomyces ipomoeae TaxID=103232 RepID=UPI0029BEC60F|nr:hypothetical protein [Streptomyces ipomoeae]MDX2698938.1 hypothetical protein [Streptomyces ipomoeae]MDX2844580.1 hypothetical protein [Streptomyces ipomoeae]
MTAMQLNSADGHGRGLRALRLTTHVLRRVGDRVQAVALGVVGVAVAAWMVNGVVDFTPVLDVTEGVAILLILATWGVARLIEGFAYDVADWIDPDARDGDDLFSAATLLQGNVDDLRQGADYDDIRLGLQASNVLPVLYVLTTSLRNEYANDGEMEEASALSDTAALVRAAAESFGHKDIGSFGQQDA